MSCYEWERGTIKIPAKEWTAFRKGMIQAWNDHQMQVLQKVKDAQEYLKKAVKGKRGKNREVAMKNALDTLDYEIQHLAVHTEYDRETNAQKSTINPMPKKKDMNILPLSKDADMEVSGAQISLRNETKCVMWDVEENNHARDRAKGHPIARELFRRLDRMKWTRGSGGTIVGNDEYNRENDYEGGGGNYVTNEYGPKDKGNSRSPVAGRFY